MYSSSSCRNSSVAFFVGGIDIDEVSEHTQRFHFPLPALFHRGEEALDGFGGIGAVREDFVQALLASIESRSLCTKLFQLRSRASVTLGLCEKQVHARRRCVESAMVSASVWRVADSFPANSW